MIHKIGNSEIRYCSNTDPTHGISTLEDESVVLTFTSPPYWHYIDYEGGKGVGNLGESYEVFLRSLDLIFKEVWKKTVPGGKVIINVTNLQSRIKEDGKSFVRPYVNDIIDLMGDYMFYDEIIWHKMTNANHRSTGKFLFGSYPYPDNPKILTSIFENILVFKKDGKRPKVDDETKEKSKISFEDWKEWTRGIWEIALEKDRNHPATFPIELAERIIRLYSFVGDTVMDPFVGSGTTVIAAEKLGRKSIGYEISDAYVSAAINKENKHLRTLF